MSYIQIRSPRIILRATETSRSSQRAVPYGKWRSTLTDFTETFERLLAPGNPGREWGRMLVFKMWVNKRFAQGAENTRGEDNEGSL